MLVHATNLLIGAAFLYVTYRLVRLAFTETKKSVVRVLCLMLAWITFMMGIVPVVTAKLILWQYVFSAGVMVLLYGCGKIVSAIYQTGKNSVI